ncbi:MAG: hypothetical protein AAFQ82_17630, partial [Myxococcota bacterium]
MNPTVLLSLELAVALTLYWASDVIFRRELWSKALGRLGASHRVSLAVLLFASIPIALFVPWSVSTLDRSLLATFAAIHGSMMAWKSGTDDIDVAVGEAWWFERGLLLICGIAVWWTPAFIPLQLLVTSKPFSGWKHHGSLPLRVLQLAFVSSVGLMASDALGLGQHGVGFFVVALLMMHGSHYIPTAIAKGILGPRWYSWMWDNRLGYVAASS